MSLLDDVSIVVTPNGYKAGELFAVIPVPTEGAEEITNGDFSSGSTGWTVINGTVTDKYNASMTSYQSGIRVTPFNKTGTFKVTFDLVVTSGSCKFDAGGANNQIFTTSGAKEILVINTSKFEFNAFNLGWVGTLDNVSVKEYTSADMDVTRATAATRVDENGLVNYAEIVSDTELITNGDFATDSDWSKGTGWAISGGSANCDGSQTGTSNLNNSVSNGLVNNVRYVVKYTISNYSAGSIRIKLGNTGYGDYNSANGTYTATLTALVSTFPYAQFNADASFVGSIDNVSVKEVTRDNVPRIDYTGGGCPHILAEPQRTNLVTYSEDFSDSSWTKLGAGTGSTAVITSNYAISPDGTQNATRLVCDLNGGTTTSDQSLIYDLDSSNTSQSISIYIKSNTGSNQNIYFANTFGTGDTSIVTSDWQRFEFNHSTSNHTFSLGLRGNTGADDTADILIWGAQAEVGSYATSYIPTSGSTVTRNQDIFTRDGIGSLINSTEGVLFAEIAALTDDGGYRYISLSDGTTSNFIVIRYYNILSKVSAFLYNASGVQGSTSAVVSDITQLTKVAFKWKDSDFALWVNGVEAATGTGSTFSSGALNTLNFDNGIGGNPFYGKVKQLQVYDTALTDEQLAALTS